MRLVNLCEKLAVRKVLIIRCSGYMTSQTKSMRRFRVMCQ
ncbi:hypothetical protein PPEP_a1674 [Pseudoalteromonas peptidolytica F12-50-A1]|uniref:Uncharacterized protein n=1 Tax=Pseudoalteromonas peptidolytica F12-50-A1 TaxID=1315280 RepID=A0A8I0MXV0_9GAMM|nr:hypothetical protein [Pseudoalteromonas peptidolytica F12-50-A1]